MTRAEVEGMIQEELKRSLGQHAGLLNLRESDSQRRAREEAEDRRAKEAKRAFKQERRELKESRRAFRDMGMTKAEAKAAAEGRPASGGLVFRS